METMHATLDASPLRRASDWLTALRRAFREYADALDLTRVEAGALQTLPDELRFLIYAQLIWRIDLVFDALCCRINCTYDAPETSGHDLNVSLLSLGTWKITTLEVHVVVTDTEYARYLAGDRIPGLSRGRVRVTLDAAPADGVPVTADDLQPAQPDVGVRRATMAAGEPLTREVGWEGAADNDYLAESTLSGGQPSKEFAGDRPDHGSTLATDRTE